MFWLVVLHFSKRNFEKLNNSINNLIFAQDNVKPHLNELVAFEKIYSHCEAIIKELFEEDTQGASSSASSGSNISLAQLKTIKLPEIELIISDSDPR